MWNKIEDIKLPSLSKKARCHLIVAKGVPHSPMSKAVSWWYWRISLLFSLLTLLVMAIALSCNSYTTLSLIFTYVLQLHSCFIYCFRFGVGEMAQQLRAYAALAEDLNLVPSNSITQLTITYDQDSRGIHQLLLASIKTALTCTLFTHTHTHKF